MDQVKIGKFIAECRKKNQLTQVQLAEKLNITDRAVSKWERGKSMPDSSIMLELCKILKISVNDLLSGEVVTMDAYNENLEKNLLEAVKQKQEADKRLLSLETLIGIFSVIILLRISLIVAGLILAVIGILYALKIEQEAGYYECAVCHHRYVPTFNGVLWAMHMGRTRYMRCPECGKRSWNKKVLSRGLDK